ncbi:hypothetical protein [Xylanibacter muris]|uniref:Uncharacterized protein n=1 Tax=Xylanibacter muris TaxID=2736290 RepID=A0ABX2AII2_9BACT|nr:hypothetical protein [Xylanibacter muris]NPD90844.1 hypothetical protein [Xylanibacter muris]
MKKEKIYVKPHITIMELETESLLTSFSISGGVSGPVGIKYHDPDGDKSIEYPTMHSIWTEEYREKNWCEW